MVLHVLERALKATRLDEVVVLTDDERIYKIVDEAGHSVAMTSSACANGTERIADFVSTSPNGDIFVNIQGDEVLLEASHVDVLVDDFLNSPDPQMGTLAHWVGDPETLKDPSTIKLVCDIAGNALYFSRNCIPVTQGGDLPERTLIHIGVYIYTRETVLRFSTLPQTLLEKSERLEQLRALEHDIKIGVTIVENARSLSVDTAQDLSNAQRLFPISKAE